MKSRSPSHVVILALCVLALFVAQTFGSKAGYVCVCGGEPVPTQTSHCHGPHGKDCHADDTKPDPWQHAGGSHDEKGSGDCQDHQVVTQEVQSLPAKATQLVMVPPVLLAILPVVQALIAGPEAKIPVSDFGDFGKSPPFGVTVARTIVLRI